MGCDIHSFAEVRKNGKWEKVGAVFPELFDNSTTFGDSPINWRDYNLYSWLADVRNYLCVPAISPPRGIPDDVSPEVAQANDAWAVVSHSHSWLSLAELLAVDYDVAFGDKEATTQVPDFLNGKSLTNEEKGKRFTLRKHLSEEYFQILEILKTIGDPCDVRIVFWFDS